MNVIKTRTIDVALRTLDDDDRRMALAWFDRLGHWEDDEHIREMAKQTADQLVYSLNTPDDIKIFFNLHEEDGEIVILDLARPSRFKFAEAAPE